MIAQLRPLMFSSALILAIVIAGITAMGISAQAAAEELTVEVVPNHIKLAYGGTVQFSVEARDAGGDLVTGTVTWEVVPDRLGSVTADGTLTAEGIGRGIIRASVVAGDDRGVGHAMFRVSPVSDPIPVVIVEPRQASFSPGEGAQFRARVTHPSTGEKMDLPIEWQVVPPTLGQIDQKGSFVSASRPGAGHVVARVRSKGGEALGQARVVVGHAAPPDLEIEVTPGRAFLAPGENRRFEAILRGAEDVVPPPVVEWSVLPPELGTIGIDGTFLAGAVPIDGRVVASVVTRAGITRGFAKVAVRELEPFRLAVQIHPHEAVLVPGGELSFDAVVMGPEGVIPDATVKWEVRPAAIGDISQEGLFTATALSGEESGALGGSEGLRRSGEVVAHVRYRGATARAEAKVTIEERPATPVWLRVRPARTKIGPGDQTQFFAEVVGEDSPSEAKVIWTVRPEELGTISDDGLFTANDQLGIGGPPISTYEGVVIAEARMRGGRSVRGQATVAIRTERYRAYMQPSLVTLVPGATQHFRILVNGSDYETLGFQANWEVAPPDLGTVSPNGDFRANPDLEEQLRGQLKATVFLPGDSTVDVLATIQVVPQSIEGPGIGAQETR